MVSMEILPKMMACRPHYFFFFVQICYYLPEVPEFQGGAETNTITTEVGNTVILPCNVTANPEAAVVWEREGVGLPENRSVAIPTLGLVIDTAQLQDTGSYTCKATNILGSNAKTIILEVQSMILLIFCLIKYD